MRLPLTACIVLAAAAAYAAQEPEGGWRKADQTDLPDAQIQQIIDKFAAKEAEFARARENYTYRQTSRVQEIDPGGAPMGKREMIVDVIFSSDGRQRTERVVKAPVETLRNIQMTPEDEQDLRNIQPFVLTTSEIAKYNIRYLGKSMADEIPCYIFAVKPKKMEKGQRYFQGEIWVDDRDMQIVKTYGRGVGIVGKNNLFPKFETYREQIDGKYWFPTYTVADDTLYFENAPQRIKMLVKYENYKQFRAESEIKYGGEAAAPDPAKPAAPNKP